MDLELLKKGFDYAHRKRRWVLLFTALGFMGYRVYKVYHLPSVVKKRKMLLNLLGALISIAEAVSDSAKAMGVFSKDLKEFLLSDSDQIPSSLRQVSKITRSDEFYESVIRVTGALTVGILRGFRSEAKEEDDEMCADSRFTDRVLEKLLSTAGSGFASVVGSFVRNLVVAFYSDAVTGGGDSRMKNLTSLQQNGLELHSTPKWVSVMCDEKCRELLGDCIQLFVSTAVAVYLDKTMDINPFEEFFSGLTNPKHERKMKDMLASICNGAVETLVRTSNQVLTSANSNVDSSSSDSHLVVGGFESRSTVNGGLLGQELPLTERKARKSFDENEDCGWVNKMYSSLAVPSNRKLVLDVTGRVTFEMVRSSWGFCWRNCLMARQEALALFRRTLLMVVEKLSDM